MLALTRKTDYALIALSYLAQLRHQSAGPVSAKQIAEVFGLPLPLLMNILKELVQTRVLSSTRGAQGGYSLAVDPAKLSILEVVTALEGPVRLTPCSDGLPIVGQGCELAEGCPIRGTIRTLHRRINGFLAELTLADLQDEKRQAEDYWPIQDSHPGRNHCGCRATLQDPTPGRVPAGVTTQSGA